MAEQYTFHDMTFTWLDGVSFNGYGGQVFGPVPRTLWGQYYPYNELNQIASHPFFFIQKVMRLWLDSSCL